MRSCETYPNEQPARRHGDISRNDNHVVPDFCPRAIACLHEVSVLQMNRNIEIHLAIEFLQTPLGSPNLLEIFLLLLAKSNHVDVNM